MRRSARTAWQSLSNGVLIIVSSLIAISSISAASESPATAFNERYAAIDPTSIDPQDQRFRGAEVETKSLGQVAEARRALLELKAFIEDAARTVELSGQLKISELENKRLRRLLERRDAIISSSKSGKDGTDGVIFDLTRTVIDNWLQTVRLQYRLDEADQELIASTKAWHAIENRLAKLKQTMRKRRAKLLALRKMSDALREDVSRTHRQVVDKRSDTVRFVQQDLDIVITTQSLRDDVASALRAMLLKSAGI